MEEETGIIKTVILDGDELQGTFTRNSWGWFVEEVNGIAWNYKEFGAQLAKDTPQEAAEGLWKIFEGWDLSSLAAL
jgi:hypothetical protein